LFSYMADKPETKTKKGGGKKKFTTIEGGLEKSNARKKGGVGWGGVLATEKKLKNKKHLHWSTQVWDTKGSKKKEGTNAVPKLWWGNLGGEKKTAKLWKETPIRE